jgi:hypothetical protein
MQQSRLELHLKGIFLLYLMWFLLNFIVAFCVAFLPMPIYYTHSFKAGFILSSGQAPVFQARSGNIN